MQLSQNSIISSPMATQQQFTNLREAPVRQIQGLKHKLDEYHVQQTRQFEKIMLQLDKLDNLMAKRSTRSHDSGEIQPPTSVRQNSKLELHYFDGANVHSWVECAERYFRLRNIKKHLNIDIAFLYLTGKAAQWFDDYITGHGDVSWPRFVADLIARFKTELNSSASKESTHELSDQFIDALSGQKDVMEAVVSEEHDMNKVTKVAEVLPQISRELSLLPTAHHMFDEMPLEVQGGLGVSKDFLVPLSALWLQAGQENPSSNTKQLAYAEANGFYVKRAKCLSYMQTLLFDVFDPGGKSVAVIGYPMFCTVPLLSRLIVTTFEDKGLLDRGEVAQVRRDGKKEVEHLLALDGAKERLKEASFVLLWCF